MAVSIIIPVLNEEHAIVALLEQLQQYREQGHEVIVVDGGSTDNTVTVAKELADKVINSPAGRAVQMNSGAAQATHDALWFLHADSVIYPEAISFIEEALKSHHWGRFNVRLSGKGFIFRIIEAMMNVRSCISAIATGDQGIFVRRDSFEKVNGYPEIGLMEDIALSNKLKTLSSPCCIKMPIQTSSRRWEQNGIFKTILLMWRLRFLYWLGVDADKLARSYR